MKVEKVIIIDFGGQYSQLIARKIRELSIFSEILPYFSNINKIIDEKPKAIIFSGGPASVYEKNSPSIDEKIFSCGIPILGICYGAQLIANALGGKVKKSDFREYGKVSINIKNRSTLFENLPPSFNVWMSHTDYVENIPEGFLVTSSTSNCPISSFENRKSEIYGLQFHPEVFHTDFGSDILANFLYKIAGCKKDWIISSYIDEQVKVIRETVKNDRAICALSGGVDSSVAATLAAKAIGKQLICIFVDHGLLRKGEKEEVISTFSNNEDMLFVPVDASKLFLSKLKNITEPEEKRKIIGKLFIDTFTNEAKKLKGVKYLIQGTIYPDIVESGTSTSAKIKSHHNVGGLPDKFGFSLVEPLKLLFKDEVRIVGKELGLPASLINRQPFPGPGLAIRIVGQITENRLSILRETDYILRDEISKAGLSDEIWQYFTVLPGVKTVGIMGDTRTYSELVAIRAVESVDGMTANWYKIPYNVLEKISSRIVNEVNGVNRVVLDITSKPPATIEWE